MIGSRDVLRHYVERHNRGVVTGDFAPLLEMFHDSARLELARALAERPPSDQLVLLAVSEPERDVVEADYAWKGRPRERAGKLRIELRDASIARLVIKPA